MWTAISTIIFYLEISAIIALLFLIWKESVKRTQKLEQALIDVAMKSSEAAHSSSEAFRALTIKGKSTT